MRRFILFLLIAVIAIPVIAQQTKLPVPRNIMDAYEKGTRSWDGAPGPNYWVNGADYVIQAEIFPETRIVKGDMYIAYHNNSPDDLKDIVFRLYQNLWQKGSQRDFNLHPDDMHDGVKLSNLVINGEEIDLVNAGRDKVQRNSTNMKVILDNPIKAGSTAEVEMSFEFIIPLKSGVRMGTYDSTNFYVAYWYPEIAVYDDIDGWDEIPYMGMVEFYNDINNFDVKITAPDENLVWAAGVLQNPADVLEANVLEKYNKAKSSETVVNIVTVEDRASGVVKGNGKQTWHWKADEIPAFVFTVSDNYLWDGVAANVEEGRTAFSQAAYAVENNYFNQVALTAKQSLEFFSTEMPAWPYPWPEMTIFMGSGGMESPMMINDGDTRNYDGMMGVTSHEIAHTYFPFYMGINEKKYAYMDEGWAVHLPFEFQNRMAQDQYNREIRTARGYAWIAGTELDIPLTIPSFQQKGSSYRNSAYSRSSMMYEFLEEMMGTEKFLEAMHLYMERWHGKHPGPYDFYFTMEQVYGEELSWYWMPWAFEWSHPDLAVKSAEVSGDMVKVTVVKAGNIPIPVVVTVDMGEGEEPVTQRMEADVWKDGKTEVEIQLSVKGAPVSVKVGADEIPDTNPDNNVHTF